MTRAGLNLRRVDIIGAFRYRNRIMQGIKAEHRAGTASLERFPSYLRAVVSATELGALALREHEISLVKAVLIVTLTSNGVVNRALDLYAKSFLFVVDHRFLCNSDSKF